MNDHSWGWRNGSVVKSPGCSCRGPGFNYQHPHGAAQLSEIPVPWDPMSSSSLNGHCMHMVHRHTCRQNTYTHKIKMKTKQSILSKSHYHLLTSSLLWKTNISKLSTRSHLIWPTVHIHGQHLMPSTSALPHLSTSLHCSNVSCSSSDFGFYIYSWLNSEKKHATTHSPSVNSYLCFRTYHKCHSKGMKESSHN